MLLYVVFFLFTRYAQAGISRKVMARLSTNQRISKRDLMSADLSVIAADAKVQMVVTSCIHA